MTCRYTYQIATGGFNAADASEDITAALETAFSLTGPGDVIIGWRAQGDCYRQAADVTHRAGKRLWLWLPVFSELPQELSPIPAISYMGREQQGFEIMPGEDFQFACPTNAHNIEIAYTLYRRHFAHLPFDGVFLDKIRHASFAGGLENGLGCFCESCRDVYARQGVDADEIVQLIRNNPAAFLPADMRKCIYRFENEAVDRFYQAKANIITSAVAALTDRFLEHRLPVALDVFAPLLAYLVGQDLLALSVRAAFIKPMIYCITHAPAGLPFELKWLRDCFAPHDILARMGGDIDTLCSKESVKAQLRELKPDTLRPGFEINIVPDICESSPGYVASFAALLAESGFANAVLSWNLLGASGDNLKALSGCFYSTPT